VAGSIEDPVRLVTMLPKDPGPKLRERIVVSGCQFSCHSQSCEARTVNRHQSQIPAHLHGRDGPPGEIIKCQNSDGRITEERLGKAHLKGGSEVADAELAGSVIEPMYRRLAAGRAEPNRIPGLRVNSHPAGSGSDTTYTT
jgi:hypothetical protein